MNTRLRLIGLGLTLGGALVAPAAWAQGPGGLIPTPENPPTQQGTRGSAFLHLPVGARANAMGGAVGATVAGPTAWYWNPAGSAGLETFTMAAGRQNLYGDMGLKQTYATVGMPLLGGAIGISFNTMNSGDIDKTDEANPFGNPDQGLAFQWNSTAVGAGYARRLTDRLNVGAQVKYITEGIQEANVNWMAFDVGTQFSSGVYGLVIGGSLQNLGGRSAAQGALIGRVVNVAQFNRQQTRTFLETRKLDLPTTFNFSLANTLVGSAESVFGAGGGKHSLMLEVDASDAVDMAVQVGAGAEYGFKNMVFLRGGKRIFNDDRDPDKSFSFGLSGGFGLRLPIGSRHARFDYSFTNLGELQNTQVFSFELGR